MLLMRRLEQLDFDNAYHRLSAGFYLRHAPQPHPRPYLVAFSPQAATLLDLDPSEAERPEFLEFFNGDRILPGAEAIATAYAGHQFGVFVPLLGDGRALLLGQVRNTRGERWELQLKGAGKTPFSRNGDGRAVLRSTIREYLCSEAMHGLGIPTTRALAIIGSDAPVLRERVETGAVLVRLAPSHVRFGHFELYYYRDQPEQLRALADHVIANHYPQLEDEADPYLALLERVCDATASLVAQWMSVGFAHGVMNTDNMSVLGLTIDYGPFGFMDAYRPGHICNHSDHTGRYAFDRQPGIAMWNLGRFAQTLVGLTDVEGLQAAVDDFPAKFTDYYYRLMTAKLGLVSSERDDVELVDALLAQMAESGCDYSATLRSLAGLFDSRGPARAGLRRVFSHPERFDHWSESYRARLRRQGLPEADRRRNMNAVNPVYVLRNHLAQVAIERAEKERDYSEIARIQGLLRHPFDEQPGMESYAGPAPPWAEQLLVSCSS